MKLTLLHGDCAWALDTGAAPPTLSLLLALLQEAAPGHFAAPPPRVLARGRVLALGADGAVDLAALGVREGARVPLLARTAAAEAAEAAAALTARPPLRVKNDLPGSPLPRAPPPRGPPLPPPRLPGSDGHDGSPRFGFGEVAELRGWPRAAEARARLVALASHPGVLAVMRARGWFVPVLAELAPAPRGAGGGDADMEKRLCALGLNEGRGARISLRLRTDDGAGFRRAASGFALDGLGVLDVLYHELAHIEQAGDAPHSPAFYALEREVKRAADGYWGEGRALGGGGGGEVFGGWEEAGEAPAQRPAFEGGSGVLGGGGGGSGGAVEARERAARAAEARQRRGGNGGGAPPPGP